MISRCKIGVTKSMTRSPMIETVSKNGDTESMMPTVAEMVDDLRQHHGLSNKEIGRQIGESDRAVERWKRPGATMPDEAMRRLQRLHRRYKQLPSSGLMPVG